MGDIQGKEHANMLYGFAKFELPCLNLSFQNEQDQRQMPEKSPQLAKNGL